MNNPPNSQAYEALNRAWKSTCRVLLGGEIGELGRYEPWLSEHMAPMLKKKSALSGKDVCCAMPDYAPGARFLSLEEIDFGQKFAPLNINEIKDIDSIIDALGERFAYCGNMVLGNSSNVEQSSDVHNSFHVLNANFIHDCKYVAYSSYCSDSKYLFSVFSDRSSSHMIRVFETFKQARCFEAWECFESSDCYFSSCVEASQEAIFSFNLRNRRHVIGNLELPKDKYLALKAKLVGEMREELERKGRLPSLMDIISSSAPLTRVELPEPDAEQAGDLEPMEEAFRKTTGVLLGRPLDGLRSYENWLMRHVPATQKARSVVSGRSVYVNDIVPYNLMLKDRLVKQDEVWKMGVLTKLEPSEIESFEKLKKAAGRIAYFCPEGMVGESRNIPEVAVVNTSLNCYHCGIASFNENTAYSYWARNSKYMFGSALAFLSSFCMNANYSTNLSRAFEADGCNNCSDVYFAHNCENARDAMFCFNAKNLHSAIGNSPLPPEQYRRVKGALLAQMADELEQNKELKWDIYNIGGRPVT
ncbi:MAG: hypothetical protein PHV13_04030 [Candidatus ainarchaeum sp.]|nr:hypothetical protein [Candidatus ainarchaeum sp.]